MSDTNIVVKPKPPSFKKGIAANREKAEQTLKELDPTKVTNRLGLVFDDSGSMSGEAIDNAHKAVKNFTDACNFTDTSIALYPLNKDNKPLTVDYDVLNLYVMGIPADGGTPLYTILLKMIQNESITRAVVFSDGGPTDAKLLSPCESWDSKPPAFAQDIIKKYNEKEISIDTIYIGIAEGSGYKEMQEIARLTGGIFIHFENSTSLSRNLKYLAPRYRALLANAELKEKVQRGESL
jgi:Mg-chelatase subunit ChlD